jgi:hypothetical protein
VLVEILEIESKQSDDWLEQLCRLTRGLHALTASIAGAAAYRKAPGAGGQHCGLITDIGRLCRSQIHDAFLWKSLIERMAKCKVQSTSCCSHAHKLAMTL